MTREDAIKTLKELWRETNDSWYEEVYDMAINALEADRKTEPTTQAETQNSNLTFEKRTMRDCYNCKRYETEGECIECKFEPKDEPQNYCDDCLYTDTCDSKEFFYACTSKATISKMEQVETMSCGECKYAWWNSEAKQYECSVEKCPYNEQDEPQTCEECKHWNDTEDGCADRHGCRTTTEDWQDWKDKMWSEAVVTEPQTELVRVKYHCINCAENGSFKCTKCDGEMYFKRLEPKDEPQTEWHYDEQDATWYPYKHEDEPQTCSVNGRPYDCGNCEYHKCTADEPQTERIKTPDYCDICNHKGCGNCIANNLDDYCVPSGYEPITQTETKNSNENSNLTFETVDTPQKDMDYLKLMDERKMDEKIAKRVKERNDDAD